MEKYHIMDQMDLLLNIILFNTMVSILSLEELELLVNTIMLMVHFLFVIMPFILKIKQIMLLNIYTLIFNIMLL